MTFFHPELWFLLPVSLIIGILGMSSGISGSNFWIPVYILWLGIDPHVGFWLALLTMIFGFGSGVWKNIRQGTVNWYLVGNYLKFSLPAAIAGAALSGYAPKNLLLIIFALFVTGYGGFRLYRSLVSETEPPPAHDRIQWGTAAVAGFLLGLIATGLGKLILPTYADHRRIRHHAEAVGTTVVIVFIVNLAALVSRMNGALVQALLDHGQYILGVLMWVAPGVVAGGQFGPVVARKLSRTHLNLYVAMLLILVGVLMMVRAW
ncbi:MAG: sulfite exporter TauE/SafE family protein [Calditrichaeota bacterium]|nr:MAG: sulfite exporter TauE/SafE family protein [Calditrichota bacterium]